MGFEEPKKLSPEEMAKIEKERALSDAELPKGGARMEKDKSKERTESPKIEFPEDMAIVRALQNKLTEYKERLEKQTKDNPYKAPEVFADTKYKITILEELLTKGEVDGEKLFKKITNTGKEAFNFDAYNEAYKVIEDYAKTGGKGVVGGTGLKLEQRQNKKDDESGKENIEKYTLGQIINAPIPGTREEGPVVSWRIDEISEDGQEFALKGRDGSIMVVEKKHLDAMKSKYKPEDNIQEKVSRAKDFGELSSIIMNKENRVIAMLSQDNLNQLMGNLYKCRDSVLLAPKYGGNRMKTIFYMNEVDEISYALGLQKKISQLLAEEGLLKKIENEISDRIKEVKSFKELFTVIDEMGGIIYDGDYHMKSAESAKKLISKTEKNREHLRFIPANYGLRQKVEELLKLEQVRKKINS